mmetsp:Transcript_4616/g.13298  ORF Transcript_4616/g.13298 Transcript_4616/m.13298 type:complete len:101 (+) Transcript_4616:890-1192(+)
MQGRNFMVVCMVSDHVQCRSLAWFVGIGAPSTCTAVLVFLNQESLCSNNCSCTIFGSNTNIKERTKISEARTTNNEQRNNSLKKKFRLRSTTSIYEYGRY